MAFKKKTFQNLCASVSPSMTMVGLYILWFFKFIQAMNMPITHAYGPRPNSGVIWLKTAAILKFGADLFRGQA